MSEIAIIICVSIFFSLIVHFPFFKSVNKKSNIFPVHQFNSKSLSLLIILNLILLLSVLNLILTQINFVIYLSLAFLVLLIFFNFRNFTFERDLFINLFIFFVVVFILAIDIAHNLTFYWDTQKIWYPKALLFFKDGLISDLRDTAYPHYSFFGSLLWAFFWNISNIENEYMGRIFYLVIFCFSIKNFINLTYLKSDKKIISFLFLILLIYDYWLFRGTQEILVFSFLLICFNNLFKIICENKSNWKNLLIVFLSLNLLIWTKNEGIILSFVILSILIVFIKSNANYKVLLTLIFFLLIFVRFFVYKLYGIDTSLSKDFDFRNLPYHFLNNLNFNNLIIISKYVFVSFLKFPHIFLSLLCALMLAKNKVILKKYIFLYIYLISTIFLLFLTYLSSDNEINFMVSTGSLRLMFEFSSPYLFFILIYLRYKLKKFKF